MSFQLCFELNDKRAFLFYPQSTNCIIKFTIAPKTLKQVAGRLLRFKGELREHHAREQHESNWDTRKAYPYLGIIYAYRYANCVLHTKPGVPSGILRRGADSPNERASGYYKCQKYPKNSHFTFRRGVSMLQREAIAP